MRLLITGAAGFVGSWLARTALENGHHVYCGVRNRSDRGRIRALGARWPEHLQRVDLDLRDNDCVRRAFESSRPDAVIHAAAYGVDYGQQDVATAVETNILGTVHIWNAANATGVGRLVHIGTSYEYGSHADPIDEQTTRRPVGIYGKTKAMASDLLQQCGRAGAPKPLIFWLFGVFGPGEGQHKLVPQVVRAAKSGEYLALSDGMELRDYMFIGDAARSIVTACTLPREAFPAGQGFNLCSGEAVTVRDVATRAANCLGAPTVLRFGMRPPRPDAPSSIVGDPTSWQAFCSSHGLDTLTRLTRMESVLGAWDDHTWEAEI